MSCLVRVNSLIRHVQLKKMSAIYESAHVAITLQLLEMSSITTSNQTMSTILLYILTKHKVHFSKSFFFQKNISDFTDLHNEKINLEVSCKWNRFGYWNSCERLPNFLNVASFIMSKGFVEYIQVTAADITSRWHLHNGRIWSLQTTVFTLCMLGNIMHAFSRLISYQN